MMDELAQFTSPTIVSKRKRCENTEIQKRAKFSHSLAEQNLNSISNSKIDCTEELEVSHPPLISQPLKKRFISWMRENYEVVSDHVHLAEGIDIYELTQQFAHSTNSTSPESSIVDLGNIKIEDT